LSNKESRQAPLNFVPLADTFCMAPTDPFFSCKESTHSHLCDTFLCYAATRSAHAAGTLPVHGRNLLTPSYPAGSPFKAHQQHMHSRCVAPVTKKFLHMQSPAASRIQSCTSSSYSNQVLLLGNGRDAKGPWHGSCRKEAHGVRARRIETEQRKER
jgi:hypothetical protein